VKFVNKISKKIVKTMIYIVATIACILIIAMTLFHVITPIFWKGPSVNLFEWLTRPGVSGSILVLITAVYFGIRFYKGVFKIWKIDLEEEMNVSVLDATGKNIQSKTSCCHPHKKAIRNVGLIVCILTIIFSCKLYVPVIVEHCQNASDVFNLFFLLICAELGFLVYYSVHSIYRGMLGTSFYIMIRNYIFSVSVLVFLIGSCFILVHDMYGYHPPAGSGFYTSLYGSFAIFPFLFIPYMIISWLLLKCIFRRISKHKTRKGNTCQYV